MVRILVFGMTENPGGVESFLVTYYRNIDRSKVQFDFLCNSYEKVAYEDELIAMGGRTYHFTSRRESPSKFRKELTAFFEAHASEYAAIWVNVCSLANIDYLKFAKRYGISKRIIHSHNSQNMDGFIRGTLHALNKRVLHNYATDFWACSEDAVKWFYPESLASKAVVIHNAIDVSRMAFDPSGRSRVRTELGIDDDCYLVGNVGRLHFQKNQSFALDVFKEFLELNPDSKLVLVGQGEDEQMLKNKVSESGIGDNVIFTGVRGDVPALLSSFDAYLFPSLFEGLSIAALEAEANGLPVLASSDVISEETKVIDNFTFFSLEKTAKEWALKLNEIKDTYTRIPYEEVLPAFRQIGYEIKDEAVKLQNRLLGE